MHVLNTTYRGLFHQIAPKKIYLHFSRSGAYFWVGFMCAILIVLIYDFVTYSVLIFRLKDLAHVIETNMEMERSL